MKKNKIIVGSLTSAIVVATTFFIGNMYFKTKSFNDVIYPGVKIAGIDVGGKTKEKAKELVENNITDTKINKLDIKINNKVFTLDISKTKISNNIDETLDSAFNYGKNESLTSKYKLIKSGELKEYKLRYSIDDGEINKFVETLKTNFDKTPLNAKISLNNEKINITEDVDGYGINEEKLKTDIRDKIANGKAEEVIGEGSVIKANITKSVLATIDSKISTFTTSFESSSSARATNVSIAASIINGYLLMPGEVFSFNNIVGQTTPQKGFQMASVIVGSKIEQDYGGGICQVSTTLYNTIMKANIIPTERSHHNLPVSYVPIGCDAAISYGNLDFKFKNTFTYPIYVQAVTDNRHLTFNLYSSSKVIDKNKNYVLRNDVYEVLQPKINYVNDPNVKEGIETVIEKASQGYKVRAYLDVYENGNKIDSKLVSNDTFYPVSGKISRGTQK